MKVNTLCSFDLKAIFSTFVTPSTRIATSDPNSSSISKQYKSGIKSIINSNNEEERGILTTKNSTVILIQEKHPAYSDLSQCDIALTTVGANTAELGSLNIPMIVVVPTQHILVMEAWDGLVGLIIEM